MSAKSTWQRVTLGAVCEFRYGKSLPKGERSGGLIPVFGSNGPVGRHNRAITDGSTIIIGRKGSFGEVALSDSACWPIDTTYYVDSTATDADLKWLFYRLRALGLTGLNRAAAIPGLNRDDAYRLELLLPPIEEQRRIAAVLDQADALRAKRREALAQLDELTQSIFLDMFGDPVRSPKSRTIHRLGDEVRSMQYGPRFYNESYSDEGVRIVRITDLDRSGHLNFDGMPKMAVTDEDRRKFQLTPGDIVFARTGATVGKLAIIREIDPPSIAGAYFIRIRLSQDVLPDFAAAVLRSKTVQSIIWAKSHQSAQQNFSGPGLRELPLPVPPLPLQQEFARRAEAVKRIKVSHRAHQAQLDSLFASLQSRAFRGEL